MIVVPRNKISQAQELFPAANDNLIGWYQIIKQSAFACEEELSETFGSLNPFKNQYEFKIPGSTLLVHTIVNFETQVAYIDRIQPGR